MYYHWSPIFTINRPVQIPESSLPPQWPLHWYRPYASSVSFQLSSSLSQPGISPFRLAASHPTMLHSPLPSNLLHTVFLFCFITLVPCPSLSYELTMYPTKTCFCQLIPLLLLLCFMDSNPSLPTGWLEKWLSTSIVADLDKIGIIWNCWPPGSQKTCTPGHLHMSWRRGRQYIKILDISSFLIPELRGTEMFDSYTLFEHNSGHSLH